MSRSRWLPSDLTKFDLIVLVVALLALLDAGFLGWLSVDSVERGRSFMEHALFAIGIAVLLLGGWLHDRVHRARIGENSAASTVVHRSQPSAVLEDVEPSGENLRDLFDSCPVGVSILSVDGTKRLFMNRWMVVQNRYPDLETGMSVSVASTFVDQAVPQMLHDRLMRGEVIAGIEIERVRWDDSRWWSLISAREIEFEGMDAIIVWQVDITKRKEAEERVRASEKSLHDILDRSPMGITILSRKTGKRVYANAGMRALFGIPDDLQLDDWPVPMTFSFRDPKDNERLHSEQFYGEGITNVEMVRQRRDGSVWWCQHNTRPTNFAGEPAVIVWHLDISSGKKVEAELSEKETLFRSIIASAPAGMIVTDAEMRIVVVNERFREIFQGPDEMLDRGKNYEAVIRFEINRGDYGSADHEPQFQVLVESIRNPTDKQIQYHAPSGRVFQVRRHPVGDGCIVSIVVDMTEQIETQNQLRQALSELELAQDELVQVEKMASLGGLVAGIAHEINTPIGTALTASTHVREETLKIGAAFRSDTVKRSQLDGYIAIADEGSRIIEVNLGRAAELIRSFKQIAVDQSSEERRSFNVDSYVSEIIQSLKPQLRAHPNVDLVLEGDANTVIDSFPGAFSQVLSNLLVNALTHAFRNEGQEQEVRGQILIRTILSGDQVRISFEDNGQGMSAAICEKIFEPFFTTRRGSGGSGLGMHIVYNLVTTTLAGTIRCFSTPGEGTRFDITLPVKTEAAND
ncbi:ATP-binding protein [Nisaea sp.]|uniref:PAS domain-containing sensor histidine kinase n=2 Tax=Alphaproteobacteria TaxID=28211 RepID=UPI0032665CAB